MKLAVATSADEFKLHVTLREMGMDQSWFDALVNGLDIERKKPAPDILLEAAKAAGARCVGITSSFTKQELLEAGTEETSPSFDKITLPF